MEGVSTPLIQHSVSGSGFPDTFVVHRQMKPQLFRHQKPIHKASIPRQMKHREYFGPTLFNPCGARTDQRIKDKLP